MPTLLIPYSPTPRQAAFHSCAADEVLYGGAAGGGKSEALLFEALAQCLEVPGNRALLLRTTYPQLERSLIRRSVERFPRTLGEYNSSKHRWTFANGSTLEFGFLENDTNVAIYQSAEYGFIGFDELTHFSEYQYLYMLSRLRTTNPAVWPRVRAATNPGSRGHGWVKARFIDPATPETVWTPPDSQMTRCFIPATVWDNPHLVDADPGYVARLQGLPEDDRRALLDGDWDIFAGQVFREFRRDIHVLEPFEIPRDWQIRPGFDHGTRNPTAAVWLARDPASGWWFVVDEHYEAEQPPSYHAEQIRRRGTAVLYADPSTQNRNGPHGERVADVYLQLGVTLLPASNDWDAGVSLIKELLHWQRDEAGALTAEPRLYFFSTCRNVLRELTSLTWKRAMEGASPSERTEGDDHGLDSLRYALVGTRVKATKPQHGRPTRRPVDPTTGY